MDELEAYERQLANHAKGKKLLVFPLLSWDIHLDNMYVLSRMQHDIAVINKITEKLQVSIDIIAELKNKEKVIVITDANYRIEFASSKVLEMTGYLPLEIIGQEPKIFQGPATSKELSSKISEKIKAKEPFNVTLINYKKDNSTYNCNIKGYPIFDKKGRQVKYVAIEQVA